MFGESEVSMMQINLIVDEVEFTLNRLEIFI